MLKQIILVGAMILFTGCSSKNENQMEKSFVKMQNPGIELQKTEKVKISKDGEVKILLTATYLNGEESLADKKEKVREKFIVGLYQASDVNQSELISEDQNLTINLQYPESDKKFTKAEKIKRRKGIDRLPLLVKKLSMDDPMLKNIPMVNTWSDYYYVEFPHTKRKQFSLTYQNKIYGKIPMKKKKKKKKKNEKSKKENQKEGKDKKKNSKSAKTETSTDQLKKTEKKKTVKKEKKNVKEKKEKKEVQKYRKYKMNFAKKAKYLYRGNVKVFR
jgi:hypothetical protein